MHAGALWGCAIALAAALIGCGAAPQVHGWVQVETEHIRLRTSLERAEAVATATRMQALRDALADSVLKCAFRVPGERIEVITLPSDQFELLAPPRLAGFFLGDPLGPMVGRAGQVVMRQDLPRAAYQVFQHELAHRLVAACFPAAPVWLHEGLAGFLETAKADSGRIAIGLPPFIASSRVHKMDVGLLRGFHTTYLPLTALPTVDALVAMRHAEFHVGGGLTAASERERANYAAAWALVHYLELGPATWKPRFHQFLGELNRGSLDPAAAWSKFFGAESMDREVKLYLENFEGAYLELEYTPPPRDPPRVRALSKAEGELEWAWLLSRGSLEQRTDAKARAQRAAQDVVHEVPARALSALLELSAGDSPAALGELRTSLKKRPDDLVSLVLFVEASIVRTKEKAPSAELSNVVERLRKHHSGSARIALAQFELLFGSLGQALVEAQQATALEPQYWLAWTVEGLALAAVQRFDEADKACDRSVNLVPHDQAQVLATARNVQEVVTRARKMAARRGS